MKKQNLFRIVLWFCSAVVLALLIACGAAAFKWHQVSKSGEQVVLVSGPAVGDGVVLGEKFPVSMELRLPWGVSPSLLTAEPAEGSQLCAEPRFVCRKIRWGYTVWDALIELQAYAEGQIGEGRMTAMFSSGQSLSEKIPAFRSKPVAVESEDLALASRIEEKTVRSWWKFAVILLLILAVCGVVIRLIVKHRRAVRSRALTPWELAVNAIHALMERVRSGNVPLERSVAELTDIVREYMERRFHLRAEHQTTSEFLSDLERGRGAISDPQRAFLTEFLSAADMVKFARVPADRTLFERAAEKAERLVAETTPAEKKNEKETRS